MAVIVPNQYPGFEQVLFKLERANFNVTTDQPFVVIGGSNSPTVPFGQYYITQIRATIDPTSTTTNLTTAAGGIYTAASKGGSAIVAAAQAYSTLASLATGLDLTIAAAGAQPLTGVPILSLTTAQGAASLVNIYIKGIIVTGL